MVCLEEDPTIVAVLSKHRSAELSRWVYQLGDQRGLDRAQMQLVEECLTRSLIL